jgi:hypothetical protein
MKNPTLFFPVLIALLLGLVSSLFAQDDKYTKAMEENLASMHTLKSNADWQGVANKFERIASMKSGEWLPLYWVSYCYLRMSFEEKELTKKDQLSDQADKFCQKIADLKVENDEIFVLKAYIAQARLSADGMGRWQIEGMNFKTNLEKAKAANPENPRIYLLSGQNIYHTPEGFGGGKANALPLLKQAQEKFATFKPSSVLHPNWGEGNLQHLLGSYK